MPTKRCYYEVLQIERTAGQDDIKRAYRKLALQYHPDNYKGDKSEGEARFKELAEAYEVLSEPQTRMRYDKYGHEGLRSAGIHDFSSMGFGDIFSMFEDIFGGGVAGSRRRSDMGMDLETQVDITLEQVASGVEQTIEFQRMDYCEVCGGTGAKAGSSPAKCNTCGGYGQVQQQTAGFFGMSVRVIACPDCNGRGTIIKNPCKQCSGSGRVKKQRTLNISIPAGIHDGQVLRVRGEGEPSMNGTVRGDLHVYVQVKEHTFFTRRNDDIICSVPVSFVLAVLGGTVTIPTLAGPEQIEVPAGVQHGHVITLKRRGLPHISGRTVGHQHVQIMIEIPKKLTARQKELLAEYARTEEVDVTPTRQKFFDRLKDHFKELAESITNNLQVPK